jgi:hypothetical protein
MSEPEAFIKGQQATVPLELLELCRGADKKPECASISWRQSPDFVSESLTQDTSFLP